MDVKVVAPPRDGKVVRSDREQADHHHICDTLHTEGIQNHPKDTENSQRFSLLQREESRANYLDGCSGAVGARKEGGEQRCKGDAQSDP